MEVEGAETIKTPNYGWGNEGKLQKNKHKVLVTGGAGFIGSHLCERLLKEGNYVICLDDLSGTNFENIRHLYNKENFLFMKGDIRDKELLKSLKVDVIFHLAAQISVDKSIVEPEDTISRNVLGTLNVLEAARINRSKVIYASTCEVYGSAQLIPQNERHPTDPTSAYGLSKLAADKLCKVYYDMFRVPVTVLRCFNVFGPRQSNTSYGAVIAIFTSRALNGKPPVIHGEGNQTRDYSYVDDVIEAYIKAMETDFSGVVNIGSNNEVRIKDLADKIIETCGKTMKPVYDSARPNDVMRSCCDNTEAKNIFGWTPKNSFDEGLKKYIEWFRERGEL